MDDNLNKNVKSTREHYIPQFILRNFSFDKKGSLNYFSKKDNKTIITSTRDIFMEKDFYDSSVVNSNNLKQIEEDFSIYEREIGNLIRTKILDKSEIILNKKEVDSLTLFCALLAFRSKNTSDSFNNISEFGKQLYAKYQNDGNFNELWKRNLSILVKCRSVDEIINRNDIDNPIKIFMLRDCDGLFGRYFVFFERRGKYDFIIGDCYPLVVTGYLDSGMGIPLISFLPISPKLCFGIVNVGAEKSPSMYDLCKNLKKPMQNKDYFIFKVKKLYENEVLKINESIYKNSNFGLTFKDKSKTGIDKFIKNQ